MMPPGSLLQVVLGAGLLRDTERRDCAGRGLRYFRKIRVLDRCRRRSGACSSGPDACLWPRG